MAISVEARRKVISGNRRHEKDSGSPQVQIAVLTAEIDALSEHLKDHEKDHSSRRGLLTKVSTRNRLLRYLSRTDRTGYEALIARLGLRK